MDIFTLHTLLVARSENLDKKRIQINGWFWVQVPSDELSARASAEKDIYFHVSESNISINIYY